MSTVVLALVTLLERKKVNGNIKNDLLTRFYRQQVNKLQIIYTHVDP